jgi:Putative beta-lactamase-inhibitor-like, PepSY-like
MKILPYYGVSKLNISLNPLTTMKNTFLSLVALCGLFFLSACSEAITESGFDKVVSYTTETGSTETATLTLAKTSSVSEGKHRGEEVTLADLPQAAQDYLAANVDVKTVEKYVKLTSPDGTKTVYIVKFIDKTVKPLAFDSAGAVVTLPPRGHRPPGAGHPGRGETVTLADLPAAAQTYISTNNVDVTTVKAYVKLTTPKGTAYVVIFKDRANKPLHFDADGNLVAHPTRG